jgi:hypothetical protein
MNNRLLSFQEQKNFLRRHLFDFKKDLKFRIELNFFCHIMEKDVCDSHFALISRFIKTEVKDKEFSLHLCQEISRNLWKKRSEKMQIK